MSATNPSKVTDVETTLNYRLAALLDRARHGWIAKPEQRGVLGKGQIDVLIVETGRPHVILEAKIGMKPEDIRKRFEDTFADGSGSPRLVFEAKYDESLRSLGGGGRTCRIHTEILRPFFSGQSLPAGRLVERRRE